MCEPISIMAGAAAVGAAYSIHQGEQARKRSNIAAAEARTSADRASNAANPNRPNVAGMAADNLQAAGGGVGSTTLTGAAGAGLPRASLGAASLLGG